MKFTLRQRFSTRFFAALACAFIAATLLASCAGDRAIREAEAALAAAREVHAEYLSPGEYRSAENWLAEARVRLRAADYDGARSCAAASISSAEMAQGNALAYGRPMPSVPDSPVDEPSPTPLPAGEGADAP